MRFLSLLLIAAVGLLSTVGAVKQPSYVAPSQAAKDILNKHKNIVVFFFENQSYDYLFATFPEGHGLDATTLKNILPQVDRDNNLYVTLPAGVMGSSGTGNLPDALPNAPYEVSKYIRMDQTTDGHDGVPTHAFHNQQAQINNNRMDRFVAWSITGSYAMAYYDMTGTWLYEFARNWTLFDRWHHSAFGGSHLNHHYLVRPLPPVMGSGPIDLKFLITEDARGYPTGDAIFPTKQSLTTDMYVVSTAYHCKFPYIGAPCMNIEQSSRTIGHVLTDAGITWKWYAEGLDRYLANPSDPWVSANFFGHHQPFVYYKPWTDPKVATFFDAHADETKFFQQLAADKLPQVSWVKPSAEFDYHAGQNNPSQGMIKMREYSEAILASPAWKRGEILAIYTFDENGGHYDHVPPYKGDRFGPGCRVPTIIQSPHYKKGFVNHLPFETLSIMRLIQTRFGLVDFLAQENPTRAPTVPDLTTIFDQTDNAWDIPVAGEPKVGPVKLSCPTCPTQCGECKCNAVTCPAPPTCPTDPHQGEHGHGSGGAVNVNFGNMFNGFKTA